MASKLAIRSLPEQEYLSNPKYEHCEYIDGEAVELNLGTGRHSNIQMVCGIAIGNFLLKHRAGRIFAELRCQVTVNGRRSYYQPDVAVILGDNPPDFPYAEGAPDFVIEIRSPDDRISAQERKIQHFFENGCRLAWLIVPEDRSVRVFQPNAPLRTFHEGDVLNLDGLLTGFEMAVTKIFE